jgi:hypothetical protein
MLDVWEDPALLIGVPFLVLGGLGALVALGALVSYWIRPT